MQHWQGHEQHEQDQIFMREALELAQAGLGWASPNPPVGALIVRDGRVLGRGAHMLDGTGHAEVLALEAAGDARGATCYVSLEPCSHQGRQPPCTTALIEAGVARVVFGCHDADERSACQAESLLGAAGIAVQSAVLEEECRRFLDFYSTARRCARPFVHLKLALSADGRMACANGASQWLSGAESLGYAHYLRQKYDAILVAYRTVLADDPRLTVREEQLRAYRPLAEGQRARNPLRVVLDPRFSLLPELARYRISHFEGEFRAHLPRLVIAGLAQHAPAADRSSKGIELLVLEPSPDGRIDMAALGRELWRMGVQSILVEGGPGLVREILRQGWADKLSAVYTPRLIGADGLGFVPELGAERIEDCPEIMLSRGAVLGDDLLLEGYLSRAALESVKPGAQM